MCFDTGNENGGGGQKAHNLCTNFQCKTVPLSTVCVDKLVHQFATQNCVPNITERNAQKLENSFIIFSQNAKPLRGRFEDPV